MSKALLILTHRSLCEPYTNDQKIRIMTCWFVSWVEYSRQTEAQRVIGLNAELDDVDDGDGGVLTRRQTAHTQLEHIWTLFTLFQQKRLLPRAHSIIILIPRLQETNTCLPTNYNTIRCYYSTYSWGQEFTPPFQNLLNVNYFTKIRGIIQNTLVLTWIIYFT